MKINTSPEKIKEVLERGVENIYPSREKFEQALKSGRQLKIYNGIDPTGPSLHLGHGVVLIKLRQLQDLGHKIILLIGDFTGMIGDPTDKTAARQKLTRKQVLENCKNYKNQAGKILDIKKTEVKYNSKWLGRLKFAEILELAARFTVPRLLERDMFQERIKEGKTVSLHEFLYPLMQAYDSVVMDVDVEIGGNDQTFNMLAGRDLMKELKNKEKFVLTTKLLVDPTGKKMGKTEGNMITLEDAPEKMYGRVMSWPDTLMPLGFEICTRTPMGEVKKILAGNPRDAKMKLAFEIVKIYHSEKGAKKAEEHFVNLFQKKETPEEIEVWEPNLMKLRPIDILVESGLCVSRGEARRVVRDLGMRINNKVIKDEGEKIELKSGDIIQKGKRHFIKIK